jgi:hypothetical protein
MPTAFFDKKKAPFGAGLKIIALARRRKGYSTRGR